MNRKKEDKRASFAARLFKNYQVREAVVSITVCITGHASEAINRLIDRLFHKHK